MLISVLENFALEFSKELATVRSISVKVGDYCRSVRVLELFNVCLCSVLVQQEYLEE